MTVFVRPAPGQAARPIRLPRPAKLLAAFVASLVAAHVLFSAFAAAVTKGLEQHRLVNVRNVATPGDRIAQRRLLASFIASRMQGDTSVAVVGSSFSWGFSWPARDIFTAHLSRMVGKTVNLSIIGGNVTTVIDTLFLMQSLGKRPDRIVVEINPSNLWADVGTRGSTERPQPLPASLVGYDVPYLDFFLMSLLGTDFIRIVYDQYGYEQPERDFAPVPVPPNYFMTRARLQEVRGAAGDLLARTAAAAQAVTPNVALFISPPLFEGVRLSGEDEEGVRAGYADLVALCRERTSVTCLDFSGFQDSRHYGDVSHLNKRGHAAFAEELRRQLGL